MLAALVLALGLAMDATAVAAARGLLGRRREAFILPLLFGAFQAGMAAIGWLLGVWGGPHFAAWDHWVAFGLLVAIGGKMLVDALRSGGPNARPAREPGVALYLLLSIATSIDASAAGITLPMIAAPPWLSVLAIGVVTAASSALGYLAARKAGARLGSRLEMLGGLILIGLGVRVLVEHL